jgi:hypothetical protein
LFLLLLPLNWFLSRSLNVHNCHSDIFSVFNEHWGNMQSFFNVKAEGAYSYLPLCSNQTYLYF